MPTTRDEPLEATPCPLCGADDFQVVRWGRDRLFGAPGRFRIVRCRRCSLCYLNPRPAGAALLEHYPPRYFCYWPVGSRWVPKPLAMGGYRRRVNRARIRYIERYTGRLGPQTRVLDVGCGTNAFCYHLERARGCQTWGLDINQDVVRFVRDRLGMRAVAGTLFDAEFECDGFDLVTMWAYLEHEPRPLEALRRTRQLTRPGGVLVMEIPNIECLPARLFGSRWTQLDLPRHLVFFSPATIADMLGRAGYEVLAIDKVHQRWMLGLSILHALGHRWLGRMTILDKLLIGLVSLPLLPAGPFLPEFLHVVARAR